MAVSRLEPVKLPGDPIRALALVRGAGHGVGLVLVGEGSMRADLQKLACNLEVAEWVVFAGSRNQEWLAATLPRARVVVAPMAGRALVEASLSGIPIVAYDVDWHAELIDDGLTGLLVPYRDVTAMARAVGDLLSEPAEASRLGTNARNATLRTMNPSALNREEQHNYAKILGQPTGPRRSDR